jgi:hypothetical protein
MAHLGLVMHYTVWVELRLSLSGQKQRVTSNDSGGSTNKSKPLAEGG